MDDTGAAGDSDAADEPGPADDSDAADGSPQSQGHLNPGGPVTITRLSPAPNAAEWVRHYWVPQWDLPDDHVERQLVLAYPACNLVVQPDAVTLAGPTTVATHRDLEGRSRGIGVLLRPAAAPLLLRSALCQGMLDGAGAPTVADSVDREWLLVSDEAIDMRDRVITAMRGDGITTAVAVVEENLLSLLGEPSAAGLSANRLEEAVENSAAGQVDDLAEQLAMSTRSLQRLAQEFVGQSPAAMIRRRRLQEAAAVVRNDPAADLSRVAAEHGYADHAHLTRDFRRVLGFTPSQYRSGR